MNHKSQDDIASFLTKYIDNCLLFMDGDKENYLWTGLVTTLGMSSIAYLSSISGKSEDYILRHINLQRHAKYRPL